jgi:hypothetical protein
MLHLPGEPWAGASQGEAAMGAAPEPALPRRMRSISLNKLCSATETSKRFYASSTPKGTNMNSHVYNKFDQPSAENVEKNGFGIKCFNYGASCKT